MEPAGHPSPLRATVVFLVAHSLPWDATSCATIARVPLPRAKAYLTQLERHGVVVIGERCQPGPKWSAFAQEECHYRSGGNLRAYRERHAELAATYQEEHRQRVDRGRALREARGDQSLRALAVAANVPPSVWWYVERAMRTVKQSTYDRMLRAARG